MSELPPDASPRMTIAAFLLIAAAIVGGILLLLSTRPVPVEITVNPPLPTRTPEPTPTHLPIMVYVTGEVAQPETTLTLPYGSRVQDALDAVGGITENADMTRVNPTDILRDGDQVHVPALGTPDTALPTPSGGEVVYINSATVEELMTLPGIGQTTAEAIIAYRDANGPFASLDDLDQVEGIGPSTLANLEGLISFEP
ncbi:MAG: ComEA family DNA-binding protein [Anaerolineae bacterium]